MLSVDELRADVESGAVDTVVVAFTDMQGRLMGKRLHGEFFLDELDAGHSVEGCNYLLALEMEMDPVPGTRLRAGSAATATSASCPTSPRCAGSRGSRRPRSSSATSSGTTAPRWRRRRARCSGRRSSGRRRSGSLRWSAPSSSSISSGDVRRGACGSLPRPDAVGALHPRLPHPRLDLRRAVHPQDPQRDARRRDQGGDFEGRGVARAARDQLPLRRRADDGGQPRRSTRTAPRNWPTSTAARSPSWRSPTTPGSATRAISIPRSGAGTRTPSRARPRSSRAGSRGRSPA